MTRAAGGRRRGLRTFRWILAQAAAVAAPTLALGGATFNSGSLTWSWDADTSSTLGGKTTFAVTPPSKSSVDTSAFQLDRSGSSGTSTATGKGSVGYIANSTTASFGFRSGTGVAQNDAGNVFTGQTITKVQFGGLFDVSGASFGPTATGYFTLSVGGVAGANGYARVEGNVSFKLNNSSGANLRSPISFTDEFTAGGSPLNYSKTYIYSSAFSPGTITPGNKVFVSGTVAFIASNLLSPSDLAPIQFEAAAAPPTATFFGDAGADWSNAFTWAPPPNAFVEPGALIPAVPDGAGVRARFANDGPNGPRSVSVGTLITVGALHVDDDDPLTIQATGGALRFDHTVDSATMFVGNEQGTGGLTLDTPLTLADALDVQLQGNRVAAMTTPAANDAVFNEPIDSTFGPGGGIRVSGAGGVTLNSPNTYAGSTVVTGGAKLDAFAPGSLSNGPVSAQRGMLILSNANAQANPTSGLDATDNGQIDINVVALNPQTTFRIGQGAIISGGPADLQQLTIGGNLLIQPGGVIAHEAFDVSATNGNPGNLPLEPTYVFGIAADFGAGSITVGSDAAGPWRGFGSDRLIRTFGDDPMQPDGPMVTIDGTADLTAGERLVLNGRLANAGAGSFDNAVVNGRGGTVEIAGMFNPFAGDMNVSDQATLRVNGALPAVQNTAVNAGGTLGGRGSMGGSVAVLDDGMLDPGDERTIDDQRVGRLTVNNIVFSPNSILRFQLGGDPAAGIGQGPTFDQLLVNGDLVLDGLLLIEQLQFFDSADMYPIIQFSGQLTDNGLQISPLSQEIFGLPAVQAAGVLITLNPGGGGTVFVVVPEPAAATGLFAATAGLALRRRRRA